MKRKLYNTIMKAKTKIDRAILGISTALATIGIATPVLADTSTDTLGGYTTGTGNTIDGGTVVTGVKDFIGKIATYGGALYLIVAVFTLVLAVRNEDNEGRNKAILNMVAAIGLLLMAAVLNLFFD